MACYPGQPPATHFPLPFPRQRPPISFCSPVLGTLSPATQTLPLVEPHQFLAPEPTFHIGTLLPSLSSLLYSVFLYFFFLFLFSSSLSLLRSVAFQVGDLLHQLSQRVLFALYSELPPGALKFLGKLLPLPLLPRGHRELSVGLLLL